MPREWLDDDLRPDEEDTELLEFEPPDKHRDPLYEGLKQRLDLVAVMLTVIIAGVIGYVGINIMENTVSTAGLEFEGTAEGNRSAFQNATADLTSGLDSFFTNLGTVFVVIVLVVVIGYLMLLRGR